MRKKRSVRYSPIVRAGSRPQLTLPNEYVVYELLSNDLARKMEATIGSLKPGQTYKARRLREPTEEMYFGACLVHCRSRWQTKFIFFIRAIQFTLMARN